MAHPKELLHATFLHRLATLRGNTETSLVCEPCELICATELNQLPFTQYIVSLALGNKFAKPLYRSSQQDASKATPCNDNDTKVWGTHPS